MMLCLRIAFFVCTSIHVAVALKCGVSTNNFPECIDCLTQQLNKGSLDFFWNWDTLPKLDLSHVDNSTQQKIHEAFVPMLWGQVAATGGPASGYEFLQTASAVLGYNEPDQYGPACVGDWDPPAYGCKKGDYRQATSAGWAPLFDPVSAASFWQQDVNAMTISNARYNHGQLLLSPSMAQGAYAEGDSCVGVDPAAEGAIKFCQGWLKVFKEAALELDCTDFNGTASNCWDSISAIAIHGYSKTAEEILDKIRGYGSVFTDDFQGVNGRTQKTLWLTEVAMGSSNAAEIVPYVNELMEGLQQPEFNFVSHVSWFSNWNFFAFNMSGVAPQPFETWSSSLFEPFGGLSPVGEAFFAHC